MVSVTNPAASSSASPDTPSGIRAAGAFLASASAAPSAAAPAAAHAMAVPVAFVRNGTAHATATGMSASAPARTSIPGQVVARIASNAATMTAAMAGVAAKPPAGRSSWT